MILSHDTFRAHTTHPPRGCALPTPCVQVLMRRETSLIVAPPPLPCSGRRAMSGESWTAAQCGNEVWAWLEAAEEWAEVGAGPCTETNMAQSQCLFDTRALEFMGVV